jgi:lipopolysaccharide/colanic/teichoic acid biosynthesis glycosyltransferase
MTTAVFASVFIGVVARLMGDELKSWSIWLRKRILRMAVAKLPKNRRQRYDERWESRLEELPGEIAKLICSIRLLWAALGIRKAALKRALNSRAIFRQVKRLFDVLFSAAITLALSPTFIAIAIAVKLGSGGPLFSFSERIGKRGRVFRSINFRTMLRGTAPQFAQIQMNGARGESCKIGYDLCISCVGRLLRKFSLDALPMLFNILNGDMSVVGPPALCPSAVDDYDLSYLRRFDLRPGITDLWAFQDPREPSFVSPKSLYETYAKNSSIGLDLKIIVRTVALVLMGKV